MSSTRDLPPNTSSPSHAAADATTTTSASSCVVDVDDVIRKWAERKLGGPVEKIDASAVRQRQTAVAYRGAGEWFATRVVHEEIFDNVDGAAPAVWNYAETVAFPSSARWTMTHGYRSRLLPASAVVVEFPAAEDGKAPLTVTFDAKPTVPAAADPIDLCSADRDEDIGSGHIATKSADNSGDGGGGGDTTTSTIGSSWNLTATVRVLPFSSVRVSAEVRTCRLDDVHFSTDVELSGVVKITGGGNGKSSSISASIADALANTVGVNVLEGDDDGDDGAGGSGDENVDDSSITSCRRARFHVEGRCSGEVGLGA